jgi:uncharacterized membrane protein YhiD involved in acid resistance
MDQFLQSLDASSPLAADHTLSGTLLSLLLAFLLGQVIAWTYAHTHSGLSYSRSFTQSLVLMTLIVAMVMYVIGNSIITAFGLLGALALIRFRNVLKDTRDTVFVLIALVVGMSVGTQRYLISILGTVILLVVAWYLDRTSFGSLLRFDGYLTLQLSGAGGGSPEPTTLLRKFCRAFRQVSTRNLGDEDTSEFVFQIGLKDPRQSKDLLEELRTLHGVTHVSLLLRSELSEV